MNIAVLVIGIVLLFVELNLLGLIVALIGFILCEVYRRKEDKKSYSVAAVLLMFYIVRYILYYFVL